MRIFILSVAFIMAQSSFARRGKTKYIYKKYEKFDFSNLNIDAGSGAPGDLSINPRNYKNHKNKLPSKPHFKREMSMAIDGIR